MIAAHRFLKTPSATNQISYIRRNYAANTYPSGTVTSFSPSVSVVAGHKAIMFLNIYSGAGTTRSVTSVTDSVGNTWAVDYNGPSPNGRTSSAFCSSNISSTLSTSSIITVNLSGSLGSSSYITGALDEWSFPVGAGVDKSAGTSTYGTTISTQLSTPTTNSLDLIISGVAWQAGVSNVTGPTGYTRIADNLWYMLALSKQQYSASYSWTNNSNTSAALVAYLP